MLNKKLIHKAKQFLVSSKHKPIRIAVIGDLAIDKYVHGSVDRISPEAPVPILLAKRKEYRMGCAANVYNNLSVIKYGLNLKIDVMGIVGNDLNGQMILNSIPNNDLIIVSDQRSTTLKTRYMSNGQQLIRVDVEDTRNLPTLVQKEVVENLKSIIGELDGIIMQDYGKGFLSKSMIMDIIDAAFTNNVPIIVDPNRNTSASLYLNATMITPNVSEAEAILGRKFDGSSNLEVEIACRNLKNLLNLRMVMITRSQYGLTVLDEKNKVHHLPAVAKTIFDVTGAGDTVVSMFTAAYLGGAGVPASCLIASAAAGVVISKIGTSVAMIHEILKELDSLV